MDVSSNFYPLLCVVMRPALMPEQVLAILKRHAGHPESHAESVVQIIAQYTFESAYFLFNSHIKRHHFPPITTSVGASVPFVQGVPDAFGPQNMTEVAIVIEERVLFADGKNHVHLA